MRELIEAVVLGVVQGLTEFLPVSSSGHLEIAKALLGDDSVPEESKLLTIVLHFATAVATIWVFRKDIGEILAGLLSGRRDDVEFAAKIVVSMVPAAAVGLLFEEELDYLFARNLSLVGMMLVVTGLLLFLADRARATEKHVTWIDAALIGLAQAVAILPGISRSGATISTSVLLGVDRTKAARFSFLMVVPLIFGAIAKDLLDGDLMAQSANFSAYAAGFTAALLTGIFACQLMIRLVQRSQLRYFAYYCFVIAALAIGSAYV